MSRNSVLDRFIKECPLAVLTRCIIGTLSAEELDEVFDRNRSRQYDDTIKFSAVAASMAEIVVGTVDNRNQAYDKYKEEIKASNTAYYRKLNRTEPAISEAVVRYSCQRAGELMQELDFQPWEVVPGFRAYSLDGNHLQKTEKRLTETRGLCAAPLPGTAVARFNHQTQTFDEAYLLEDAHAQESSVLDRAINDIQEGDLVIADRHFCILDFLFKVANRSGSFLIRQHGRLKGELRGKRRFVGRIETGKVYEQDMVIRCGERQRVVRRITVCLDKPTRDGDTELHLLSNVPAAKANACRLAQAYQQRWEIENAFYVVTTTLNCESKSNCHPRCALFQFCMALVAYNCRQVLMASLYAEHQQEDVDNMSQYKIANDIVRPMDGMLIAIDEAEWDRYTSATPRRLAAFLRQVARRVDVKSYRKSVRGPKKPPPKRKRCKAGTHVSTAKLLAGRKQRC
jgi:hypothetical protein